MYYCPHEGPYDRYKNYILKLPTFEKPEVFGLHDNAEISAAINDANGLCGIMLGLLPRTVNKEGVSQDELIKQKCQEMILKLPAPYDLEEIGRQYPIIYEQSMNTVLQQELIRYNRMLTTVVISLETLEKAIDGLVTMSNEIDEVIS